MGSDSEVPDSSTDHEKRIIALAQTYPKGLTDKEIQEEIPELTPAERAAAINKLLGQNLFDLFNQNGKLLYKLKDQTRSKTVITGDNEEKVVFGIIEEAGNKGIWIRDIRYKSNLIPTHLNKILKILENKKLIKAVKSVNASKKKVYMLYNLEAHSSITGGAWYCDQDFEAEFVDVLNQQCYRYLLQKIEENKHTYVGGPLATCKRTFAYSSDVWKYIGQLGISKLTLSMERTQRKRILYIHQVNSRNVTTRIIYRRLPHYSVELSVEDIETILDTLVFDGKVERTITVNGPALYRATESLLPTTGLVHTPCGVCPVIRNCNDTDGAVTPKKCVYLRECFE